MDEREFGFFGNPMEDGEMDLENCRFRRNQHYISHAGLNLRQNAGTSKNGNEDHLSKCPIEIFHKICHYLNYAEMRKLASVSRTLRNMLYPKAFNKWKSDYEIKDYFDITEDEPMQTRRFGHGACYYKPLNRVYTYGGLTENAILNDLRYFDCTTRTWGIDVYKRNDRNGPGAICFPTLINYKDTLILYGAGCGSSTGMITFYVLDLITKTWNQELYNEDCVVTGGHSHLLIDEFLIIFGGQSPDGVVHNQLFIYNCELKTVYRVAYKGTQIPPRCHALMAKIDKDKIIIAGGRSILYIPYQEKIDAYHLEFSDEMRAATVTPLEVETNPVWPTQMYTNAMVGDKIVVVSNPSDMTNIKIPGPWLRSFVTEKRDLARSDILRFSNSLPYYYCYSRESLPCFPIKTSIMTYPRFETKDVTRTATYSFNLDADKFLAKAEKTEPGIIKMVKRIWEEYHSLFEKRRNLKLDFNDIHKCLMWISNGHGEANICRTDRPCVKEKCFEKQGCIQMGIRKLYPRHDQKFRDDIVIILHINFLIGTQNEPPQRDQSSDESPSEESEPESEELVSLIDLLHCQSFFPIHRIAVDAPLTATVYTLDVKEIKVDKPLIWKQQPVPIVGQFYNLYSPMVFTGHELLAIGGLDGSTFDITSNVFRESFSVTGKVYCIR